MKNESSNLGFEKIDLYEKANLKKVIEAYKEYLTITHFNIVLENKVSVKKIFSDPSKKMAIKSIELPEYNKNNFMPYLNGYVIDIDKRLDRFRSNGSISLAEKIKTIAFLIAECSQMEMQYYPYNQVLVFFNFEWRYENTPIPFSRLILRPEDFDNIKNEILLRFEFFQFIKMKLELFKMRLEAEKPVSKFIKWKKSKRPELMITEIALALEEKGYIEFISPQTKTEFITELKRIYSLKDYKWSEMVSEINKRERHRYKNLKHLCSDSD